MDRQIAVLSPSAYRRKSAHTDAISLPIGSALLFVGFLMFGMYLYRMLSPVFSGMQCRIYEDFCTLAGLSGMSPAALCGAMTPPLRDEIVYLALSFLFSFSYFCRFLERLLLSLRALSLGAAFAHAIALFRAGMLNTRSLTCFLVLEAGFSAVFLLYACRAIYLSLTLRHLGHAHRPLMLALCLGHVLRTLLCAALLFAAAFLIPFILS